MRSVVEGSHEALADRNTTEDEKGRGLPEITKLRSTATILRATYRKVWPLTNPLKISALVIHRTEV